LELRRELIMTRNPWFRIGLNAWLLGIEASSVIVSRALKIAAGGTAAEAEGRRMLSEKIEAGCQCRRWH